MKLITSIFSNRRQGRKLKLFFVKDSLKTLNIEFVVRTFELRKEARRGNQMKLHSEGITYCNVFVYFWFNIFFIAMNL